MIQREITDKGGTVWSCVQAYSGVSERIAEKAAELAEGQNGEVTVVCTPSGGAQTVRLQLSEDWEEQLADEDLQAAIEAAQ